MRHLRPILALLAIAAILVACASGPGASPGNQQSQGSEASNDGGGDGGGASQPAASTGGGGGGGNGTIFGDGSADYRISGDHTAEGELRFVPAASTMNQNGAYSLSFYDEDAEIILIVLLGEGDSNTLSFGSTEATIPGAQCDWNITRKDDNGAAGTFTCNDQFLVKSDSSTTGTADISGSFDARI
jgi:hypothetical protein